MSDKKEKANIVQVKRDRRIKKFLVVGVILAVVGGLLALGGWRGAKLYRERKALSSAQALFAKKDYAQARLSAGRALQMNPNNLEAMRLMAEIAEAVAGEMTGAEVANVRMAAASLRKKVAEMQPGVNANYIAWANAALRANDRAAVTEALGKLDEAGRNLAAYHEIAARVALFSGKTSEVEKHVTEAAKLDPTNEEYQLQLAAVKLGSPVPDVRKGAIATMEQMAANPKLRRQALRTLIQASLASGDAAKALQYTEQLKSGPNALFEDRTLYLGLLRRLKRPDFWWCLAQFQTDPPADDNNLTSVLSWLNNNGLAAESREWSTRLPEERRTRVPVCFALAESMALLKDWDKLKKLIKLADWGDLEFQREALFARALREEGDDVGARSHWGAAVTAAGERPEALSALLRFVNAWKWEDEYVNLLWVIARQRANPMPALQVLLSKYMAEGKTRELLSVFVRALELNPDDLNVKNNLAYTILLLNQDVDRGHALATEVYKADPKTGGFAATYAYSLRLKGKTDPALKIMQGVDATSLEVPSTALCYGILLAATGDAVQARKYLDVAAAGTLLPQEKTLLNQTRDKLPPL